jgi:predicted transcriptional regulator
MDTAQKISQKELAKNIKSSQSRVAKMEACDPSVSLDLIIKTLFVLGATNQDIATTLIQ